MRQFIQGSDEAYLDLERRARDACVVFRNEEMPPGSHPETGTIGFEVNASDGGSLLFVKGVTAYSGNNAAVRNWILTGTIGFSSFQELQHWIQKDLARSYRNEPQRMSRPEELTDLQAVRNAQQNSMRTLCMSQETLLDQLQLQIRGQDHVLKMLSRRVCRHLARPNPSHPLTVFEIGETGTGKTETAKTLGSVLTSLDSSKAFGFLRLDMSEYQEQHRISQLIGSPQGYIGYEDGAQLVDTLGANSRCVVLFDEIEKAHPNILRSLMNAMDAGRLSCASSARHAREIDCRTAIFIFTTNLNCEPLLKDLRDLDAFENVAIIDKLARKHLRTCGISPELVGRINCFLPFKEIGPDVIAEIVALNIVQVGREYGLNIVYTEPEVITEIINQAPAQGFGVRPYRVLLDELLGDAFAEARKLGEETPIRVCAGSPPRCVVQTDDFRSGTSTSVQKH